MRAANRASSPAPIPSINIAPQNLLVWSRNGLALCLREACRASVCGIRRVEDVNDRVYHDGLLVDGYGRVCRDCYPVI
jgi:hypothetical protein